jgi:hypothetical protein
LLIHGLQKSGKTIPAYVKVIISLLAKKDRERIAAEHRINFLNTRDVMSSR